MGARRMGMVLTIGLWGCLPSGGDGGGRRDGGADGADGGQPADAAVCVPDCGDRTCGDNGCGSFCGLCGGTVCDLAGACVPVAADCGDDTCGADEDCATCPADCGACCGNGTCEAAQGESCASCVDDCACGEGEVCDATSRACQPEGMGGAGGSGGAGGAGGAGGSGGAGGGANGAPEILTLSTNIDRLTEGEQVIVSAVVTDPDGLDDVAGGVLEAPDGAAYGAFTPAGPEGTYSLTVTWAELHAVEAIEFAQGGEPIRPVEAVFFDQGGARTRQAFALTLYCADDDALIGACGGACADLRTVERCGGCDTACDLSGAVCSPDGQCGCRPGQANCGGACTALNTDDNCGQCGDACRSQGERCVEGACVCPAGERLCGEACVDTDQDVAHCGGCDQPCEEPGASCRAGACVCEGACLEPREGELVITEVMPDPSAVTDANGEWFEIWNASQRAIPLAGYQVGDHDQVLVTQTPDFVFEGPIVIQPGEYLVICKNLDRVINGGVPAGYQPARLSLRNTDDEIYLADPNGRVVDSISYAAGVWPLSTGRSMQLDGRANPRRDDNDDGARWCRAETPWRGSAGDRGTPGAANDPCPLD